MGRGEFVLGPSLWVEDNPGVLPMTNHVHPFAMSSVAWMGNSTSAFCQAMTSSLPSVNLTGEVISPLLAMVYPFAAVKVCPSFRAADSESFAPGTCLAWSATSSALPESARDQLALKSLSQHWWGGGNGTSRLEPFWAFAHLRVLVCCLGGVKYV